MFTQIFLIGYVLSLILLTAVEFIHWIYTGEPTISSI